MNIGAPELIILLVVFGFFVLPVWGIIDAAMRPDNVWAAAQRKRCVWILVQIFLGGIGSVVYFIAIRPKLKEIDPVAAPHPPPPGV